MTITAAQFTPTLRVYDDEIHGFRDPQPGDFADDGYGNTILFSETSAAVAWWKGFGCCLVICLAALGVFAAAASMDRGADSAVAAER